MRSLERISIENLKESISEDILEKLALSCVYPQYTSDMKKVPTVIYSCKTSCSDRSHIEQGLTIINNDLDWDITEDCIMDILLRYLSSDSKYIVKYNFGYLTEKLDEHNKRFGTEYTILSGSSTNQNKDEHRIGLYIPIGIKDFRTDPEVIECLQNLTDEDREYIQVIDLYPFERAFITEISNKIQIVRYRFE